MNVIFHRFLRDIRIHHTELLLRGRVTSQRGRSFRKAKKSSYVKIFWRDVKFFLEFLPVSPVFSINGYWCKDYLILGGKDFFQIPAPKKPIKMGKLFSHDRMGPALFWFFVDQLIILKGKFCALIFLRDCIWLPMDSIHGLIHY